MSIRNPYHEGERAVQNMANEVEMAQVNSAAIGDSIIPGALPFIAQQPMVVVSSMDSNRCVWVSTLIGNPGFIQAIDVRTVKIDLSTSPTDSADKFWLNLSNNTNVGLLMIELKSRRRIRINGHIRAIDRKQVIIDVERAYPNCAKYIQRRDWKILEDDAVPPQQPCTSGVELGDSQQLLISQADTLFVGSAHPKHGIDVSHRGGHSGFVHIEKNRLLRIPDYAGNSMFNTLGNFASYPYAGVTFIDFGRGRVLQLTGRPIILWDQEDRLNETGGTKRFWQFEIESWQEIPLPRRIVWEFLDVSPFLPVLKKQNSSSNETLL